MSIKLTQALLRKAFPQAKSDYLEAITNAQGELKQFGLLDNQRRIKHFLAQGAAETGGFTIYEESGAYSAARLLKIFPKYFKSLSEAKAYANKPQAIFNRTYGGRLGNTLPGDGYKYRGRGILQLTGKDSYKEHGSRLGLDLVESPDQAAKPEISILLAISYWTSLGLNSYADSNDLLAVSRGINGGDPKRNIQPNGMADRRTWLARLEKLNFSTNEALDVAPFSEAGTLKEGDTGDEIKRLQTALRAKGYASGAIDGVFGANTRRAVQAFELDIIKPDYAPEGIFKPAYWSELEQAPSIQIERKATTLQDLKADSAVKSLTFTQRLITFLGFGTLLTGSASEGVSNFPALVGLYQPVLEVFRPLFQLATNNGWIFVCVACLVLYFLVRWGLKHILRAYQYGDYQGAYKGEK